MQSFRHLKCYRVEVRLVIVTEGRRQHCIKIDHRKVNMWRIKVRRAGFGGQEKLFEYCLVWTEMLLRESISVLSIPLQIRLYIEYSALKQHSLSIGAITDVGVTMLYRSIGYNHATLKVILVICGDNKTLLFRQFLSKLTRIVK